MVDLVAAEVAAAAVVPVGAAGGASPAEVVVSNVQETGNAPTRKESALVV